jgi:hypothetical protein
MPSTLVTLTLLLTWDDRLFGFLMSEGRSGGAKAKADYARFNESLKKEVEKRASA